MLRVKNIDFENKEITFVEDSTSEIFSSGGEDSIFNGEVGVKWILDKDGERIEYES